MTADQTPAADPSPGSSRMDVAGLRAAAEAATPGPWRHTDSEVVDDVWEPGLAVVDPEGNPVALIADEWYEADEGEPTPFHDAAFIAAARNALPALLDERDDLAARLATAEAENVRLRMADDGRLAADLSWMDRAEVAERQVQAVRDLVDRWDDLGPTDVAYHWQDLAGLVHIAVDHPESALAPLDPDAPTGRDGHGAPDTHQVDTEAAPCRHCGSLSDADGDHSCRCPNPDGECPKHDKPRTSVRAALDAWEAMGPTSLTVALLADALYGVWDADCDTGAGDGR